MPGTRTQCDFASADNITPRFSPAAHTFDVEAGKTIDKNVVDVALGRDVSYVSFNPLDKDLHGKKASVILFNPQKNSRKKKALHLPE